MALVIQMCVGVKDTIRKEVFEFLSKDVTIVFLKALGTAQAAFGLPI